MTSRNRVAESTSSTVNRCIQRKTWESIEYYGRNPERIDKRLEELEEEWDIERLLETNSSIVSLVGLMMGFTVSRRWFLLPLAVQSFLLQHALQGWCPPLPVLRRLGFRTSEEIDAERTALKAIRGDFQKIAERGELDIPRRTQAIWEAITY